MHKKKKGRGGETYSEKILKDTINYLEKNGKIQFGHKLEAKQLGKFRTPAPLDFVVVDNEDQTHWIEIKRISSTNLPLDHFKDRQYELLTKLPNAWIVAVFITPDCDSRSKEYWEEWFVLPGSYLDSIKKSGAKSVSRKNLEKDSKNKKMKKGPVKIVNIRFREKDGIEKDAGLTSRGNEIEGLSKLSFLLE